MTQVPSAVEMAKKVIKDNPSLFVDSPKTELLMIDLMEKWRIKYDNYIKSNLPEAINFSMPDSLFDQMANITKVHAKVLYGIDIDNPNKKQNEKV